MASAEVPQYDAHILYRRKEDADGKRAQQVVEDLEKLLTAGLSPLQVYVADRDAIIGSNMIDEHFRATKISRFTIALITQGFMEDNWSAFLNQVTFKTLLQTKKGAFLPIAFGSISETVETKCQHLNLTEICKITTKNYRVKLEKFAKDVKEMVRLDCLVPAAAQGQRLGQREVQAVQPTEPPNQMLGNLSLGSLPPNGSPTH